MWFVGKLAFGISKQAADATTRVQEARLKKRKKCGGID
jgi:hypothetical protein